MKFLLILTKHLKGLIKITLEHFEFVYLHVLADTQTQNVMNFSQTICNYTQEGREIIYSKLKGDVTNEIRKLYKYIYEYNTVELADNKLSKYSAQKGKCTVTGQFIYADEVETHHILSRYLGGTDEFKNLVALHKDVHKLIHATTTETIERYRSKLQLDEKELKKLNKYRNECNLTNLV